MPANDCKAGPAILPLLTCSANIDLHRINQSTLSKRLDLGRHGGGEHQRLTLTLEVGQNVTHLQTSQAAALLMDPL